LGDGRMQWSGAQWSLQLDGLALSQIASEREDLVEDMWYAVGNEIRLAWTAAEATEAGPLVTLSLRALTSGRVSEMITLAEEQLAGEAYTDSDEAYGRERDGRENTAAGGTEVQLYANYPNPWQEETMIPFEVPEAGEAVLIITDAAGREIMMLQQEVNAGRQE